MQASDWPNFAVDAVSPENPHEPTPPLLVPATKWMMPPVSTSRTRHCPGSPIKMSPLESSAMPAGERNACVVGHPSPRLSDAIPFPPAKTVEMMPVEASIERGRYVGITGLHRDLALSPYLVPPRLSNITVFPPDRAVTRPVRVLDRPRLLPGSRRLLSEVWDPVRHIGAPAESTKMVKIVARIGRRPTFRESSR